MSVSRSRQFVTFVLVVGAVFFGMVLAGGLEMTVPSISAPQPDPGPVQVGVVTGAPGARHRRGHQGQVGDVPDGGRWRPGQRVRRGF